MKYLQSQLISLQVSNLATVWMKHTLSKKFHNHKQLYIPSHFEFLQGENRSIQ